jgi:hypothetical protein
MRIGQRFAEEAAPCKHQCGEQNQPGHKAGEEIGWGHQQQYRAGHAAHQTDRHQMREGEPRSAGNILASGQAGGGLCRKKRDGRGDVRSPCIHAGEHQSGQGDEGSTARECVLHPRPQGNNEKARQKKHLRPGKRGSSPLREHVDGVPGQFNKLFS